MTEYGCYGCTSGYIVKITTAGGGLMNGNAYSELELHFENEDEWENYEEANAIYYVEHGKNPRRDLLDETFYKFKDDEDTIVLYKNDPYFEEAEEYYEIEVNDKILENKFKRYNEAVAFLVLEDYVKVDHRKMTSTCEYEIYIIHHNKDVVKRDKYKHSVKSS